MSADKIMRIMRMNGDSLPTDKKTFWLSVHKARMAVPSLPTYAKMYSKRWLLLADSFAMDDGELEKWLPR